MNRNLLIIGVVLSILGLIGYLQFSAQYNSTISLCNAKAIRNMLGDVNNCASIQTNMFISIGILLLGVVLAIIGFTSQHIEKPKSHRVSNFLRNSNNGFKKISSSTNNRFKKFGSSLVNWFKENWLYYLIIILILIAIILIIYYKMNASEI